MKNNKKKKSSVYLLIIFLTKCIRISMKTPRNWFQAIRLWIFFLLEYIFAALSATFYEKLFEGALQIANGEFFLYTLTYALSGIMLQTAVIYILRSRRNCWAMKLSNDIEDELDAYLDRHFCRISYEHYNNPKVYEDIALIQGNIKGMFCDLFITEKSMALFGSAAAIIINAVILLRVNAWVAILIFLGNLIGIWQRFYQAKHNYYREIADVSERRWSASYFNVIGNRQTVKEVRFLGITDYLFKAWENITRKIDRRTRKLSVTYSIFDLCQALISGAINVAALILTVYLIIQGQNSAPEFILVYYAQGALQGPAGDLINFFADLQTIGKYTEKWLSFDQYPDEESIGNVPPENGGINRIRFENVSFKYPGTERRVLNNISLSIFEGEKIAVVGRNGSGKTTFVSLLNQLYEPTDGKIFICNTPAKCWRKYLRRNSMTLFQDYPRYENTIRDNIKFGNIRRETDDAFLISCLKKGGFYDKLQKLPAGIETPVGTYYPDGIELSGGEWQRLALSRAWARDNAQLMIFDEPTSALDAFGESLVYKQILALLDDTKTAVIVSHRLTITPYVDRILVFDNGAIVEDGNHEELMKIDNGIYSALYNAQANLYN